MTYTKEDYHIGQHITAAPSYLKNYGTGVIISAEEYLSSQTWGAADRLSRHPDYVLVRLQGGRSTKRPYFGCVPPENIAPLTRVRIEGNELILEEL